MDEKLEADLNRAIESGIEGWLGIYNARTIGKIVGDDAMAYRLRAELRSNIILAIKRVLPEMPRLPGRA